MAQFGDHEYINTAEINFYDFIPDRFMGKSFFFFFFFRTPHANLC